MMENPTVAARDRDGGGQDSLTRGGITIAYRRTPGQGPGILFLGGFRSTMNGTKAAALERFARERGQAFVRFDYAGHGASGGRFETCGIGSWTEDALAVLDAATEGPQILVGSSMGAWIMVRVALARPDRVAALVGVAAAPDFTEDLMWDRFDAPTREAVMREGVVRLPSEYDDDPYPITRGLIEDGRRHLLLRGPIAIDRPVRLIHGMADPDVPWRTSLRLSEALTGGDVRLTLVKDGDHRLSRDADVALLRDQIAELADDLSDAPPAGQR